jgi:enterochelin esterase-like enzyme
LSAKEFLYYLFDFGDEWWHQIRVESITDSPSKKKSIKIVEKVGDSPSQYECEEDDWDEEES